MNKYSLDQRMSIENEKLIDKLMESCIKQKAYTIALQALQQCQHTYSRHDEYLKRIKEEQK